MLKASIFLCLCCFGLNSFCQTPSVVVSEFYNNSSTGDWIELLVINDNTDLRGYKLSDNGASQNSWQATVVFSNSSFWNNFRSGTIIVIWADSTTPFSLDLDKTDGYVELHGQLVSYTTSSGGSSGGVINVGSNGEIIQLSNNNNLHQHALAFRSLPTGNNFDTITNNKLNHQISSISNGQSICVCPGTSISSYLNYNTSTISYSGVDSTNRSSLTYPSSKGLPNTCLRSTTSNRTYWRSLRHPTYNSPTLNAITPNTAYTQLTLTWSACTDLNPSDSTTGYIILRNTSNSFIDPSDSVTYSIGNTIGTATVVGHINFSSTLSFTDNYTLNCNNIIYYKVYAFRFGTDNLNGNSFNAARGRAYNEVGTNVQSLTRPFPTSQNITPN